MAGDPIDLEDAYADKTPEQNRALYARWAESYEDQFIASHGYVYHRTIVDALERRPIEREAAILDAGCGTGIVGVELAERGHRLIDGIDLSAEMLAEAEKKSVYRRLVEADLTEPIGLEEGTYGALISAGVFTHGHLGPEPIARLVALLAPGGSGAIGVNSEHYGALGFDVTVEALDSAGLIRDVELVEIPVYDLDAYEADDAHLVTSATVIVFARGQ